MERKLASVQRIATIDPIENADSIEKITFHDLGWQCVAKKGEFQLNDLCCFMEIDALLPDHQSWARFMESRKYRVKTVKLRGCLSQGLALPLSEVCISREVQVGDDLTEELGIKKYEPPVQKSGISTFLGKVHKWEPRPSWIPKTDEIRIQSALYLLDKLKGLPYYISVKLDGSSMSLAKLNGEVYLTSRNFRLKTDEESHDNRFWDAVKNDNLIEKLPDGYLIQGELCGPGIAKNRLQIPDHRCFVFNVMKYENEKPKMLLFSEYLKFLSDFQISGVPILETGESFGYTLSDLLLKADGHYEGTKNRREGIVVRPQTPQFSYELHSLLSFKTISNQFLLKDED